MEKHIALLEERAKPQQVITNFQDVTCDNTFVAQYETIQGKSKAIPRKLILHEKYTFLIHKLIKGAETIKKEILLVSTLRYSKPHWELFIKTC